MWPFKKKQPAKYIGEFCKIKILAGDVVVLTCEQTISRDVAAQLDAEFAKKFGPDVSLLVLDAGMKLALLSPEKRQKEKDQEALDAISSAIEKV